MWTAILGFVTWALGFITRKKDASAVDLAATAATATAQLQEVNAANVIEQKATIARTDATDSVVRVVTSTPAGPAVVTELAREHPDDFRD
jgi:hypothetical protein